MLILELFVLVSGWLEYSPETDNGDYFILTVFSFKKRFIAFYLNCCFTHRSWSLLTTLSFSLLSCSWPTSRCQFTRIHCGTKLFGWSVNIESKAPLFNAKKHTVVPPCVCPFFVESRNIYFPGWMCIFTSFLLFNFCLYMLPGDMS